MLGRTTAGSLDQRPALRARRHRRRRRRRHAARRRSRHHRRHRPRRPDLHDAHQRVHAEQPVHLGAGHRQGRDHRRRRAAPAAHRRALPRRTPDPTRTRPPHCTTPCPDQGGSSCPPHPCAAAGSLAAGTAAAARARRRLHVQHPRGRGHGRRATAPAAAAVTGNDEPGDDGRHRLLRPGRRPRLDGLRSPSRAVAEAAKYADVELGQAEGTNDVNLQISQIETFINDGVDAIVLLPFDGAALTEVAIKAMEAGIPSSTSTASSPSPFAARTTVLGDNYGMGVSAGTYICEQLGDNPDAVVAEIAGIDSLPLTQDRSQGFADALAACGLEVEQPRRGRLHRPGRRGGRGQPAAGGAADRRHLEPRRRPGRRRHGGHRERRPRRVLHGRRRRLGERHARPSRPTTPSSRRRSSTRRRRPPTASSWPGCWCRARRWATWSRSRCRARSSCTRPS